MVRDQKVFVIVSAEEKAVFAAQAKQSGQSLSSWCRVALRDRAVEHQHDKAEGDLF